LPPPATSAPSADLGLRPAAGAPIRHEDAAALVRRLWNWRYFDAAALALLVVAIAALNQIWISTETRPPHWDMARHLGDSLVYYHAFAGLHPLQWLELYTYYPPLTSWVADAFYAVFGTGTKTAILSNAVFVAILAGSTYGIGRRLWSRRVGLLAAVVLLCTPVLVTNFKEFMLDAPLTAIVALALYLLIRSESFSRLGPSLLLGLVCGLGMLTKWTFPLFMAVPLIVAGIAAVVNAARARSPTPVINIAAAALIAFAVSGLWYLHNWTQLHHDLNYYVGPAAVGKAPPVASLASLGFYLWALLKFQLFVIPFLLLAVGLVFVFARRDVAARNLYPVLLIIGSYAISSLLRNKDVRYTLPMLPAIAVVAVSWLELLAQRARRVLSGAIVAYSAVTFLAVSFGTSLLPAEATIGPVDTTPGLTLFAQRGYIIGPPTHERWYQQQVFAQIAHSGGMPTFTYTGADSIWFNTWGTRYYALLYNLTWVASPDQAGYLVYRDVPSPRIPSGFGRVGSWTLPDGEPLYLYKRFI
jgi:4-amino-4-deoxy-L-arabinose transferase-like glycosyltransferase